MVGSVFSDKAWWHDTPSATSSLNRMRLMTCIMLKQICFR